MKLLENSVSPKIRRSITQRSEPNARSHHHEGNPDGVAVTVLYPPVVTQRRDFKPFRSGLLRNIWRALRMPIELGLIAPAISFIAVLIVLFVPKSLLGDHAKSTLRQYVVQNIKRGFDILTSSILIVFLSPLLLTIATLIKLDSKGPVIYRQIRIGHDRRKEARRQLNILTSTNRRNGDRRRNDMYGCPFELYKFRTMKHNAEGKTGPVWAEKDDPRVTQIGRFLRLTRLDELPQLVNVLNGSMSLVGPRPERYHFVAWLRDQIPSYCERLKTKPGITGLAQVSNGYDSSVDDVKRKLEYDLHYVNNMGFGVDLKILFKTMGVIIGRKGAH